MRISALGMVTVLTALSLTTNGGISTPSSAAAEKVPTTGGAAPGSLADDPYQKRFCTALHSLMQAADHGFATLRAAPKKGRDHVWTAKLAVPGGTDCVIFGGEPAAYTCDLYAGDIEATSDDAYLDASARLKACLPEGWTSKEKVDGAHARTLASGHPSGQSIRIVERDASADAYLVEFWFDAAKK